MEFQGWPKTPRLNRDAVYTEKLDGTNGAIIIEPWLSTDGLTEWAGAIQAVHTEEGWFKVGAQSRNRLLGVKEDNAGFGRWVNDNAEKLVETLGEGRHFGEWYGQGIQRGYGLTDKRFALFNTARWYDNKEGRLAIEAFGSQLETVAVIGVGTFSTQAARSFVDTLRTLGSVQVPGFDRPEGVCVLHTASRQVYKVLVENDELPKGVAG